MTVKELIEELSKHEPESKVIFVGIDREIKTITYVYSTFLRVNNSKFEDNQFDKVVLLS